MSVIRLIDLTTTGTTAADATYVAQANRVTSVLGVYQSIDTDTNDCDMKIYVNGTTSAEAYTSVALTDVVATTALELVGKGTGEDGDMIMLLPGDTLWLDATGATAAHTVYKLLIEETVQ